MSTILTLSNIGKSYPGVKALDDVSLSFEQGEIHALMGENGAGKSTLIKVISGAITPDSGSIEIGGLTYSSLTPALSRQAGIGVIYQEYNLIPSMSVIENVFLGDKIGSRFTMDFSAMKKKAEEIFRDLGVWIDLECQVGGLSVAKQQIVEIAKAIYRDTKVLIMDEPSAALANTEVDHMLEMVMRLKKKGVTIIYISHRLEEIFKIADRISILRDGTYISTNWVKDITRKKLIELMVGRELNEKFPERGYNVGEVVLELKNITGNGNTEISLKLHKGEILGLAGLVGAGRTELAKMIYGDARIESGEMQLKGKTVMLHSPRQAIVHGIGLIPENRKTEGAFLEYSIEWNIAVMSLEALSKFSVVPTKELKDLANSFSNQLQIKTPSLTQLVKNLSGGNQQKVVLAKVLAAQTDIIIFDEPTRGIDVGAKQEIYQLIHELACRGVSIIMISSEMEELIGMSDRIMVLCEGKMAGEVSKDEFDQKHILELASGM